MAQQDLDFGTASSNDGESLFAAFTKIQANFDDLYASVGDPDTAAIAALTGTGFSARTASDTWALRTITGTASQITVTNGAGIAGDPTLSLPADVLIPTVLTVPNTGLHILDTNASHDLIIAPGSNITADRTFTLTTGDADRTLDISAASVTISSFATTVLDDTTAAAAATTLGLGTGDSPQFTAVNVGHATDTTITRTSAGVIAVEGNTVWHAGNDGSGSTLDADLLDGKNTGTSGNVVPLLDGANTWSAQQTFSLGSAATTEPLRAVNTTDNASVQVAQLEGDRATMAANDEAYVSLLLSDSAGTQTEFGRLTWRATTVTDTSEAGRLQIGVMTAGTLADEVYLTGANFYPASDDGNALGLSGTAWADLFLASGGVINWNAGNATLTHSAGLLTSNVPFSLGTSNALTAGSVELGHASDTTLARVSAGVASIEGSNIILASNKLSALSATTSAELAGVISDETGSGALMFATSPTITTDITIPNTGLHLLDTNSSHDLIIAPGSDLTADRTLTITTGDAARTLDISAASVTISSTGASLIDDASTSAMRTTLGLAIGTDVQAYHASLAGLSADAGSYTIALRNAGTAGAPAYVKISTLTDRAAFGAGDKLMIEESSGELRKIDYSDLPGAGAGLSNVVEDTTPQLGGQLDVNGFDLGDGTLELLRFSETASAVNELTITNAATTNPPKLAASGDDANVGLKLASKGTGSIFFEINGSNEVTLTASALSPSTSDGNALGTTALMWADLFLADGGVINFNNGNATLTHSTGLITSSVAFSIGTSNALTAGTIELGAASDTTIARSAAGVVTIESAVIKTAGTETVYIPAVAMIARTTTGAASGNLEMTTNKNMFRTLDFDGVSAIEYAQFGIRMPKSWNEGTITARFTWSHPSTATNFGVVWALEAVALSDDDAGDVAFGTAQQIADTGGTTNDVYITSATPAITIAGTPAAEDWVLYQVKRIYNDASDTMQVDARLHGVTLYITTDATNDA